MTTEERALHLAKEFGATKANKESAIYRACIKMATEQKAIDIDKACEWLKEEVTFEHPDYRHAVPLYDNSDIEAFRKYMEE